MNTISMISKQTCRTAVIGYCLLAFGSLTVSFGRYHGAGS